MEKIMEREKPFKHIGINEFGFFVRQSETEFEGGKYPVENTFESWKKGTANNKICWTISVEKNEIKSFINTCKQVYLYIECILVPENSDYSVEQINELLQVSTEKEKSEVEKIQDQMNHIIAENNKLREELESKKVIEKAPVKKSKK